MQIQVTKALPLNRQTASGREDDRYLLTLPFENEPFSQETTGSTLTDSQKALLEGTVLHNVLEPKATMLVRVPFGDRVLDFPIPPISLFELDPRTKYDSGFNRIGTRLRLDSVRLYLDRMFFHVSEGRPPIFNGLRIAYAGSIIGPLDRSGLRTRISPGASSFIMGGDTMLKQGEIGFPIQLASEFLNDLIRSLPQAERAQLSERRARCGVGILDGLEIVFLRNPVTVYGACRKFKLRVLSTTGRAIYITSKDISLAGGDFDGDLGFAYVDNDSEGLKTFRYCMESEPRVVRKTEKLQFSSTHVRKGGISREVSLENVSWFPENDTLTLKEFMEKKVIGLAWFALVNYQYAGSHLCTDFRARLMIIRNYLVENPESPILRTYNDFVRRYSTTFDYNNLEHRKAWTVLQFRAVAEAFFVLYEFIFDMRKGDLKLSFSPSEVISGLMGYGNAPIVWDNLKKEGVWSELLKHIYDSLDREPGQESPNFKLSLAKHPVFLKLVHERRGLTAASKFISITGIANKVGDDNVLQEIVDSLLWGNRGNSESA